MAQKRERERERDQEIGKETGLGMGLGRWWRRWWRCRSYHVGGDLSGHNRLAWSHAHLQHQGVLQRQVVASVDQQLVLEVLRRVEVLAGRLLSIAPTLQSPKEIHDERRDTTSIRRRSHKEGTHSVTFTVRPLATVTA